MTDSDRARWDRRYADPSTRLGRAEHPLLAQYALPAPPGARALELACGLGQTALWLAEHGYTVHAIDISLTALRRARAEQVRRGVRGVTFIAADLDTFPLPRTTYDLVVVFRFLDRRLFPAIRACVRPGGLVIYETLNIRQRERMSTTCPEHMLQLGELPGYFAGWELLLARDEAHTSALVARKPLGET